MTYTIEKMLNDHYCIDIDNHKVASKLSEFIGKSENFDVTKVTITPQLKKASIIVRYKKKGTVIIAKQFLDVLVRVWIKKNEL